MILSFFIDKAKVFIIHKFLKMQWRWCVDLIKNKQKNLDIKMSVYICR